MKKLLINVSIIIGIVFLVSLAIDTIYRSLYHLPYELPRNIFILPEIQDKYDIVKLGNSHAESGIVFDRYGLKSLSLVGVGQPFEYDLAHLKMHSRQIKKGAVILIAVSPLSFSQKKGGRDDSLQTNYYDGRLSPFLIPNINVGDYLQSRIFPFLRAGYLLREKNMEAIQKRISKEEKWPDPTPTPFNPTDQLVQNQGTQQAQQKETASSTKKNVLTVTEANYYSNVEAIQNELALPSTVLPDKLQKFKESVEFMVAKWYNTNEFSPQYFETTRKDLEKIIAYSLDKGWKPVLITIPISKALLSALKPDYMQVYVYDNIAKTNLHGTQYLDFSGNEQITKNTFLFGNSDHLSKNGASIFSYLLLRTLIEKGYLPETADRYDYGPLWKSL